MVTDTFKVREQFGINDARLVGATAFVHTANLIFAVQIHHIVNLLFHGGNLGKTGIVNTVQMVNQRQRIPAYTAHFADFFLRAFRKMHTVVFHHFRIFANIHRMVADTLQIARDFKERADLHRVGFIDLIGNHIRNIAGYFFIEIIYVLFALRHIGQTLFVPVQNRKETAVYVFARHIRHTLQLTAHAVERDCRKTDRKLAGGIHRL